MVPHLSAAVGSGSFDRKPRRIVASLLDRNLVLTLEVLESLLVSSGKYLVVVLAKIY